MWKVLKTFESEAEARVVESFLSAKGVDVQLLGTHAKYTVVAPGSSPMQGLRLMVRDEQAAQAVEILREQEKGAHLSIVNDDHPGLMPGRRVSVWVSVVVFATGMAIAFYYLS